MFPKTDTFCPPPYKVYLTTPPLTVPRKKNVSLLKVKPKQNFQVFLFLCGSRFFLEKIQNLFFQKSVSVHLPFFEKSQNKKKRCLSDTAHFSTQTIFPYYNKTNTNVFKPKKGQRFKNEKKKMFLNKHKIKGVRTKKLQHFTTPTKNK